MNDNRMQMTKEQLFDVIDILTDKNDILIKENIKLKAELRKWKPRKIEQYTMDGKYIKTFSTINSAAKSLYGNAPCIRACLRGDSKSSYGYKWKYVDE